MNDHYFSKKPYTKSHPKTWHTRLRGQSYQFMSDEGVFSKRAIDFGTRLLIETFHFPDIQGRILDIGCGYGPIGLSLASEQPFREVIMTDVNERAIGLSKKNLEINRIQNVRVFQSHLFEAIDRLTFSAIVSNPPVRAGKQVVYQLFRGAYEHLLVGGSFWTVVRKQQGAESAFREISNLFSDTSVSVVNKRKGFIVIKAEKNV